MQKKLTHTEWGTLSYALGAAILAGTAAYGVYAKANGKQFKPGKEYILALGLLSVGYLTKIHDIKSGKAKMELGGIYAMGLAFIGLTYANHIWKHGKKEDWW